MQRRCLLLLGFLFSLSLLACGPQSFLKPTATAAPPSATPTATLTPTHTPTHTPTYTPTPPPTATPTPAPTFTPAATPTGARVPPTPNPDLPAGWQEYILAEDGFVVWLPESWLVITLDEAGNREVLDRLARQNPQLASVLDSLGVESVAEMFALYAVDTDPASLQDNPVGTSLNVIRTLGAGGAPMGYLLALVKLQLQSVYPDSEVLASETIEVNGREAGKIVLQAKTTTFLGVEATVTLMQVYVLAGEDMFAITMGTGANLYPTVEGQFLEILETFTVLE